MKRVLILGAVTLVVAVFGLGSIPTEAQSIVDVTNSDPSIINEECSVSYSGDVISHPDATDISSGGTISFQGGDRLYTVSAGDITSTSFITPTNNISYQSDTRFSVTNTVSSDAFFNDTPTTTLIESTNEISYSPKLTFSDNGEYSTISSVNDSSPSVCGIAVDAVDDDSESPEVTVTVNEPPIVYPDPLSATLSVNDEYIVYVNYGDSAIVKWESVGTSSCTLDAIGLTGIEGEYILAGITSNISIKIECEAAPGYANYQTLPSWLANAEVKVLPPTFEYVESYLAGLQPTAKKVNLKSTSNFLDQAKRALEQDSSDRAQAFLQKSIDSIKQQESRGLSANVTEQYEVAVNYLSSTLPVTVVIASDGCSVTANGSPGLILQYGANENMRRGYGEEAVIPEEGTITKAIYAPSGFTATGEVVDSTGLIYARDSKDVTTDDCPEPPVVYDPTLYNGYPEEWANPEPGTILDDWGYFNKTPESYVAFRVSDSDRTFPTDYGDASEWLDAATTDEYIVDDPQSGDIAINTLDEEYGGPIAWYVESIDEFGNYQMSAIRSDGNMNWAGGTIEESSYLIYIRIP